MLLYTNTRIMHYNFCKITILHPLQKISCNIIYKTKGNLDINNGESIVGVNIYCKELNLGVTSNTYGFYSLTLPRIR